MYRVIVTIVNWRTKSFYRNEKSFETKMSFFAYKRRLLKSLGNDDVTKFRLYEKNLKK